MRNSLQYFYLLTQTVQIVINIPFLYTLHSFSHPVIAATVKLIMALFFWPNIRCVITGCTCSCLLCQCSKVHWQVHAPLGKFSPPDDHFRHIHIDLVCPWLVNHGFTQILTCIDCFSWWLETIPLVDISTKFFARVFISNWVAYFGVPYKITTDHGHQFKAIFLFREILRLLSVHHIHMSSYHPASNGMVRMFYRQLKAALHAIPDLQH